MTTRSVLFDLDGVLLDTEGIYTEFWREIDKLYPTGVENFALVIKGSTLPAILSTYFPDLSIQEKIREHLRHHEDEMIYRPFEGALQLLADLRAAGVSTAIVTSSNAVKMNHIFEVIPELKELVDTFVTDEDVTNSKPDPEGYLLAAKRLGATPGHYAVVEDSLAGLEAGRRAEAFVIGLATTNPAERISHLADITLPSISHLTAEFILSNIH